MLTAGGILTRRATGEVCPRSSKMVRNRDVGADHDGWGGDFAAVVGIAALSGLPVGLRSVYSGVDHGRMGRPCGKSGLIRMAVCDLRNWDDCARG